MWKLRVLPALRIWPSKTVAISFDCNAVRNLKWPNKISLRTLEGRPLDKGDQFETSELTRIINEDNVCFERCHVKNVPQLSPCYLNFNSKYVDLLKEEGVEAVFGESDGMTS